MGFLNVFFLINGLSESPVSFSESLVSRILALRKSGSLMGFQKVLFLTNGLSESPILYRWAFHEVLSLTDGLYKKSCL